MVAFDFLLLFGGIYLAALSEERKLKKKDLQENLSEPNRSHRKWGLDRGEIWIAEGFDAPLPPEIMAGFVGENLDDSTGAEPIKW